jgi:hypothetical protein
VTAVFWSYEPRSPAKRSNICSSNGFLPQKSATKFLKVLFRRKKEIPSMFRHSVGAGSARPYTVPEPARAASTPHAGGKLLRKPAVVLILSADLGYFHPLSCYFSLFAAKKHAIVVVSLKISLDLHCLKT